MKVLSLLINKKHIAEKFNTSWDKDFKQKFVNAARPWAIIYLLLEEVTKLRAAAEMIGLDIDELVRNADALDASLDEKVKVQAEYIAASLKKDTERPAKGKVTLTGGVNNITMKLR